MYLIVFILIYCIPLVACGCTTGLTCVTSCSGMADGNYQSCTTCTAYISCISAILINQQCTGNTVWDDNSKSCSATSTTCTTPVGSASCMTTTPVPVTTTMPSGCTSTGPTCVQSCTGMNNGYYQSCTTCNGYVACVNGILVNQQCSGNSVWDDNSKSCLASSSTCTNPSSASGAPCITTSTIPVTTGLPSTSTAPTSQTVTTTAIQLTSISTTSNGGCTTGAMCIESCTGESDGYYQSCTTCTGYIACVNGIMINQQCTGNNVWDDNSETCSASSTTCTTPSCTTGASGMTSVTTGSAQSATTATASTTSSTSSTATSASLSATTNTNSSTQASTIVLAIVLSVLGAIALCAGGLFCIFRCCPLWNAAAAAPGEISIETVPTTYARMTSAPPAIPKYWYPSYFQYTEPQPPAQETFGWMSIRSLRPPWRRYYQDI